MSKFQTALLAGMAVFAGSIGVARANIYNNTYSVSVTEGVTAGYQFTSAPGVVFPTVSANSNTAAAAFTYTGPIGASNTAAQNAPPPAPLGDLNSAFGFSTANISGYSGSGTVTYNSTLVANYNTLAGFIASSASAANFSYGSTYAIDLGIVAKGTVLTIAHDDGVSVYQGLTQVGPTVAGPTTVVTDTVTVGTTADTTLYYGRQNGTPSVLIVSVPEPMSIGLLGTGLLALGLFRRRSILG